MYDEKYKKVLLLTLEMFHQRHVKLLRKVTRVESGCRLYSR